MELAAAANGVAASEKHRRRPAARAVTGSEGRRAGEAVDACGGGTLLPFPSLSCGRLTMEREDGENGERSDG